VNTQTAISNHAKIRHPNYVGVWWWLLGLTLLEIVVLYLPMAKGYQILLLVFLAITKALLVAMYFMHLKFERIILIATVLYPFALAVTMTVLSMLSLYGFKVLF
jgi:cytochrome c oxidase subunit 4